MADGRWQRSATCHLPSAKPRRGGRAAEGGSLENCWAGFPVPWVEIPPPPREEDSRLQIADGRQQTCPLPSDPARLTVRRHRLIHHPPASGAAGQRPEVGALEDGDRGVAHFLPRRAPR